MREKNTDVEIGASQPAAQMAPSSLTVEALEALVNGTDGHDRIYLSIGVNSGLHLSELVELTLDSIAS
jgi:hypothetical protein